MILALSVKGSQSQDVVGEKSSGTRSYTQELLDFGISFGGPSLQKKPTNPFITGEKISCFIVQTSRLKLVV